MKVKIQVWGEGEYEQDTLKSRMVDTRIGQLQYEFAHNEIEIEVIKTDECQTTRGFRSGFRGIADMIFSIGDHVKQIIIGKKTQTRRASSLYLVGRTYSIQPGRRMPAISEGKIRILHKRVESNPFDLISKEDAFAEGGYIPREFEKLYSEMYPNWIERYAYTFKFIPSSEESKLCSQ